MTDSPSSRPFPGRTGAWSGDVIRVYASRTPGTSPRAVDFTTTFTQRRTQ
ncbi:hypothetical protein ACIQZB_28910 [Streptomyces sp. NPDC097727]